MTIGSILITFDMEGDIETLEATKDKLWEDLEAGLVTLNFNGFILTADPYLLIDGEVYDPDYGEEEEEEESYEEEEEEEEEEDYVTPYIPEVGSNKKVAKKKRGICLSCQFVVTHWEGVVLQQHCFA